MKYVVTWRERPAVSAKDHEAAQERVLGLFKDWHVMDAVAAGVQAIDCRKKVGA
jgi:hypothetical protein